MVLIEYAAGFVVALFVSAGILPAVIRIARRVGAVDRPGGRRTHRGDVPRLGGIGIYLGFVGGVGCSLLLAGRVESLVGDPTSEFPWLGAGLGATIVFVAGLLDDLFEFRARTKFLCQLLAAGVTVAFGVRVETLTVPIGDPVQLGWLSPAVTLAWILIVTNALNLIDGLDGLAGGLALIVTTTMASVSLALGHFGVVACTVALSGALVGFLRYNFNPARIFMGDGGSQFLGFMLAIISIRGSAKGATAVALLLPMLVLGLPLTDLATTIVRRALRSGGVAPARLIRRIAHADREHLHHNLLDLGLSPRRAVLALYLIACFFALSGYLSMAKNSLPFAAMMLLLSLGCVGAIKLALVVGRSEPSTDPTEGG